MIIGIDLDEVLTPTLSQHCEFLNKKYNINLKEEDFHVYEFYSHKFKYIYGATKEKAAKDFLEFCNTSLFKEMGPFPDAINGIQELKKLAELHVISSRQNVLRDFTEKWIEKHFPGIFSNIDFGNFYSFEGEKVSKLELCKRNGIKLLIEDVASHALEVSNEIPVVLFDKPWNQEVKEGGNIVRAKNWEEIVEKVKEFV